MWWDRLLDPFRGKAVTIPPMDGAFRPNVALETAPVFAGLPRPDALAACGDRLFVASRDELLALPLAGGAPVSVKRFEAAISALAACGDGGVVAGLDSGALVFVGGRHDGRIVTEAGGRRLVCPTAIALQGEVLFLTEGSAVNRPSDWVLDLMQKGASGRVLRIDLETGEAAELASRLAWPAGILIEPDHRLLVAEASRNRLVRVATDGRGTVTEVLGNLPGYPARLNPALGGGAWVALMAPRNRLVEFVLTEDAYRADMIAGIDRDHWIAPQLASGRSFLEPLQCGGVVTMGIRKPWAPSRSYGLLVRLDAAGRPLSSLHSRADGSRHGVRDAVEAGGSLYVAASGGNVILKLDGGLAHAV